MQSIVDLLKKSICTSPIVTESSIGTCTKWKRAQYIVLSEIISETLSKSEHLQGNRKNELGTTLSSITLQRIFNDNYSEKENPDLRFLKTLDKLAIFLGYPSLNNFLKSQNNTPVVIESEEKQTNTVHSDAYFQKLIYDYCQAEFICMLRLPLVQLDEISLTVFDESPLKRRISDVLTKYSKLKFSVNDQGNRSNFEVFNFKITHLDTDLIVAQVEEFWNIEWKDHNDNIAKNYNKINKQTYFIKKRDEVWKIWDNHNPDYNTLISEVEQITRQIEAI